MTYTNRVGIATVLPLAFILAVAACSDSGDGDSGGSSGGLGNGDALATGGSGSGGSPTGGASSGTGGLTTGGTSSGSGGSTSGGTGGFSTGGRSSGTGGFSTGGIGSGTGGFSTGGRSSGTGGFSTGGIGSGTGGFSTGGIGSGTGGFSTGGIGSGTGGFSTGGIDSGTGGFSTGGIDSGTGGVATGGVDSGSGGTGTGGGGSTTDPTFHIFMLMGQSNMAGVAKFENSDKNTDERLLVLGGCNQPAGQWNIANPPLSDCPGEKGWNLSDSVDPGIWFGKTLLGSLPEGDTIGLIGTAESGESITTFISGGSHHQMILNKINLAKQAEHGRFAGVIFHQGESDSGQSSWPNNVVRLYDEVKAAWGVDYDVPFILGELPAGGCCSGHNTLVRAAAEALPMGYVVSQEGTNVLDQYHFDHASVVLMGTRYGETMIEALGW